MRAFGRWALLVVTVLICVGAGFAAYRLTSYAWNEVAEYRSPYLEIDLPEGGYGSAATSRTVMVIIDGLTESASRQLDMMNRLRSYGADLLLDAGQPSFSSPNWTNLVSGAPPEVSGVTLNDYVGPVKVETLFETSRRVGSRVAFVGPQDFDKLYDIRHNADAWYMQPWSETKYMSATYVDHAIRIARDTDPSLLVVLLPDVDEAGHRSGSASADYAAVAAKVDADLSRLVSALEDGRTDFVVVSDHGHVEAGGHGGWEVVATRVPGVFSGPGIPLGTGAASQSDVAPTVAVLAGIPTPRSAKGQALDAVLGGRATPGRRASLAERREFARAYVGVVEDPLGTRIPELADNASQSAVSNYMRTAETKRLAYDRDQRLYLFPAAIAAALVAFFAIGLASWRALVAAIAGSAVFYVLYNGMYFLIHHYTWSLSLFSHTEDVQSIINSRLAEAAVAGIVAAAVAGVIYPLLRAHPKPPKDRYLPGWLTLGPVTILVTIITLALQVAWFAWQWGFVAEWRLPDLKWAVKNDFDLLQITALGAVAIVAPLVTYLVGRYHPKVRQESRPFPS